MNYEAIYHSADSQYCHALDKDTVVIRLRAKRGDLQRCIVCYGDRVYPREAVRVESAQMRIASSDRFFDYYEAVISLKITRLCYYFILSDGVLSVYYYGYDFHERLEYNRNLYFQLPYIRQEDIADVPEWVKGAVIYQIFPDSFASAKSSLSGTGLTIPVETDKADIVLSAGRNSSIFSKSKLGGTLRGIIENIPYLEDLSINCIYLTPIFTAGEYHKYDTIDYLSVDPCMGDLQTLKDLVARCHSAGIRVILDGVFNHCGAGFFAFRDVLEKGEASKYKDWFFIRSYPVDYDEPNYECFAYVNSMPKLNTGNKEVADYIINVGTYWIREADIDGWRLDVANEINHGFWRDFKRAVREVKKDVFLLAEVWYDAAEWLAGDQFDSLMNYSFLYACTDFFAKRIINVKQFSDRIGYLLMRYKKNVQYVQMNLLDSHDVPRFLSQAGGDIRRLKLAALFMMMHVGAPNIFYGDEKGMDGMAESDYRKPMQWEDTEYSRNIYDYYKKLIAIRLDHMELMLGDYIVRDIDIANDTLVFSRDANGQGLYVVINNSEFPVDYELTVARNHAGTVKCKSVEIAVGSVQCKAGGDDADEDAADGAICESDGKSAVDLITGKTYEIKDSKIALKLEELSGMVIMRC